MKVVAFTLLFVACANASKFMDLIREEWNTYKIAYNKSYTFNRDGEDEFRMNIFMKNRMIIAQHNAKYARGEVTFELGLNRFADLTGEEFAAMMFGSNRTERTDLLNISNNPRVDNYFKMNGTVEVPRSFDWRAKGCVTPVKDQGTKCGSCYAFNATGSLECQLKLKTGRLVSLSEQNIVDCSHSHGNNGCGGGYPAKVFEYVKANRGIATAAAYAYSGKVEKCRYDPKHKGATITGYVKIPEGDELALKYAVATKGTVSVSIDAHHNTFQLYSKGVYYNKDCSSTKLGHAVLAVGYGTDEHGNDYWLIKNSWGEDWGNKGYIRMARNRNNHCGVVTRSLYPSMN